MGVRPRFKKSKKRSVNFLNSPRLLKRQRSQVDGEKEIEHDIEPVYNEKLLRSPTMKLTEDHGSRARRLKSVSSLIREHQNVLKEIYGRDRRSHLGSKSRKDVVNRIKKRAEEYGESRLNRFETRRDIIRLRSGLACSPAQGAWMVSMGLVVVSQYTLDDKNNEVMKRFEKVIKSPNYRREKEMVILSIKEEYYTDYVNMVGEYLSNENVYHVVPTYREVDYTKGSVVILQIPQDGQVLRPKGCSVARASRLSY